MLLHYSHVQYKKWKTPTDSNCYRQLHTQTLTEAHNQAHKYTFTLDSRKWSDQVKQMKSLWPEWEADSIWHPEMYYSLSFFPSIYLSSLCLVRSLSLLGSPSNPSLSFCFLLTDVSFFTFAFRFTPFPLMCFFCLFLSLISAWNLCGNQPSGHLVVMMADLTAVWRWPLNPQAVALSLCPLSPPALSRHTVLRLFIFENQYQQLLKWRKGSNQLGASVDH